MMSRDSILRSTLHAVHSMLVDRLDVYASLGHTSEYYATIDLMRTVVNAAEHIAHGMASSDGLRFTTDEKGRLIVGTKLARYGREHLTLLGSVPYVSMEGR